MGELLKKLDFGTRALLSGASTIYLAPDVRRKPYPPTGIEGLKVDATQIYHYWKAVGTDISGAVKEYERKKK